MPKQPARTPRQSAKYREQQLRRRTAAQNRAAETMELDYQTVDEDATVAPANGTVATTYAPAPARTVSQAVPPRPVAAPRPPAVARRPATPTQTAVRATRGRISAQVQAMNLEEEMAYISSDMRRLLVLSIGALVILIALAFLLPMIT